MIFDMVIYVTLINLTKNGIYSTTTKELSIFCLHVLESLTLDKSKRYFVEIKTKEKSLLQM